MLMCAVNKMLTKLCHLCLSSQYYEMSYGLNIEMHKQVRETAPFFVVVVVVVVFFLHIVKMMPVCVEVVCVSLSGIVRTCW